MMIIFLKSALLGAVSPKQPIESRGLRKGSTWAKRLKNNFLHLSMMQNDQICVLCLRLDLLGAVSLACRRPPENPAPEQFGHSAGPLVQLFVALLELPAGGANSVRIWQLFNKFQFSPMPHLKFLSIWVHSPRALFLEIGANLVLLLVKMLCSFLWYFCCAPVCATSGALAIRSRSQKILKSGSSSV